VLDPGAQFGVAVDEFARDARLACDLRDGHRATGGDERVDGRVNSLSFELAVQPAGGVHRGRGHDAGVTAVIGSGVSVGRGARVIAWKRSGIVVRSWAR
jgi:hypothetical protein